MRFFIPKYYTTYEIIMRQWNGLAWSEDVFSEFETAFPAAHERVNGLNEYICTMPEFKELVNFWENETKAMREGKPGELDDYSICQYPLNMVLEVKEV